MARCCGWRSAAGSRRCPAEEQRRPYRITAAGSIALNRQLATLRQIVAVGVQRLGLA